MSTLIRTKTNFTAGELSPDLLGRGDLRAYENGAARLRNVFIHPTGGVTRRAGLRHLDGLSGPGRLVAFEFNTAQVYLLALTGGQCSVFMDGVRVATLETPWTEAQLGKLSWTQSADTLLLVHPDVPPKRLTRTSHTDWTLDDWPLITEGRCGLPFERRAPAGCEAWTPDVGGAVARFYCSQEHFTPADVGGWIRYEGIEAEIYGYISASAVRVRPLTPFGTGDRTTDWQESVWGGTQGWPAAVTFHQDRLVVAGAPMKPNHVWLSGVGDYFSFVSEAGLDDEALAFPLLSDQVNAVCAVFSGRHLQVFTAGAEWTVQGEPLTPGNIRVRRQTRVGSPADRVVPPRDVDGATLFVAASGRELREFLFADAEQAYQASDLALLARHLFADPVDMDYDPVRRLVHMVMADGTLATVTNFRREQVTAWTRQDTAGRFLAVAVAGGETYALVERDGRHAVEVFDDAAATDAGLSGSAAVARSVWSGLDHLEGQTVRVLADGVDAGPHAVSGGAVTLAEPARTIEAGLPFTHIIEPLPPLPEGPRGGGNGRQVRLIRASFRLLETPVLRVDTGRGATGLSFKRFAAHGVLDSPPPPFTGDATVRALGWQRDAVKPLWTVTQDTPLPCTILSVTTEIKVTD